ncbi:MAG: hypothetical protein SF123_14670 [Chloroflexota bacterium]|nr:hypothetical protein [Chloroflexota bacterium]
MSSVNQTKAPSWIRIAGSIAGIYAGLMLLAWIIQWVLPTDTGIGGIIEILMQLLMFPALVLLPICLLLRRWRASFLLLIVVGLFLFAYGRLLLPRSDTSGGESMISLLTFNIQAPDEDVMPIVNVIRAADADVVALQELSSPAADAIASQLSELYPHRALHPRDQDNAGQGVLSRLPILDDEYWRNEFLEDQLGHQRVELDWNGTVVTLFNTHPLPPYAPDIGFNAHNHTQELREFWNVSGASPRPFFWQATST